MPSTEPALPRVRFPLRGGGGYDGGKFDPGGTAEMPDDYDTPSAQCLERKLSTILSADVAEFSRLMGEDEEQTLRVFRGHKKVAGRNLLGTVSAKRRRTRHDVSMMKAPRLAAS